MKQTLILALCTLFFTQCTPKDDRQQADLIIENGTAFLPTGETALNHIVVKDGKIVAVSSEDVSESWKAETTIDASGKFVSPGLIEGHGHFSGMGNTLQNLDLLSTSSWQEVLDAVKEKVASTEEGVWITGRGWHQEKFTDKPAKTVAGYPTHDQLTALSPNHPVVLRHASGHGLIANAKAMELAVVTKDTENPEGGNIIRDDAGIPIGIFEENAMGLIMDRYGEYVDSFSPEENETTWFQSIELAEQECLKNGITSFQDAGASFWEIERYKKMAEDGDLSIRLWSMMSSGARQPLTMDNTEKFPLINVGNGFFTCRAIKAYMDGALGSRGAWLLEDYSDMPGYRGQNVTPVTEIERTAEIAQKRGLQLCVHAIGDRGNREVINAMEKEAGAELPKLRWRIEHAQHLNPDEMDSMAEQDIIASMQTIHCTSDSPFVEKRLGQERAQEGAYVWRTLMSKGIKLANGTDVPVEKIDPMANFYAAVTRKRLDDGSEFYPDQVLTRAEALNLYTQGNAYAAFQENEKGSLEIGKYADIVVLDTNLITCADEDIPNTKVLYTIVNGDVKYEKE